jgi:hypothetical protein
MTIHVHIERLILEGLPLGPGAGARMQAAVEAELARLLAVGSTAEGGIARAWPEGGAVPAVPAAPIQLNAGARPAEIGVQIARSVYGGIGGKQ